MIIWSRCERKRSWPILRYSNIMRLNKLRITTRPISTIRAWGEIRNGHLPHNTQVFYRLSWFHLWVMCCPVTCGSCENGVGCGQDLSGLGKGLVEDPCEYDNRFSVSMKKQRISWLFKHPLAFQGEFCPMSLFSKQWGFENKEPYLWFII